ncbi:MAG: hypothetical protein EOO05_11980 [Chitinophagaceae bacterium]|nr:MAG: hypothetical protein EOO05_11980 [Chitinophagaceae bacterium]
MNINRDNYEEFFILYGDNELGSEDRIRVEAFVLENPDLQSEFSALNQVRFAPDEEISFDHKDSLMQTAGLSKNDELLLLSVDQELTPAQQSELNDLLLRDKGMQAELDLYKKASFDPNERIVFPYKESLYRREEKARVIPFAWRRIAAAAAIFLAVSVTGYIAFTGKNKPTGEVASSNGTGTNRKTEIDPANPGITPVSPAGQDVVNPDAGSTAKLKHDSSLVAPHFGHAHDVPVGNADAVASKDKGDKKVLVPVKDKVIPVQKEEVAKTHNNLPQPSYNPNVTEKREKEQIAMNTPASKQSNTSPTQINTDKPVTITPDDPYKYVVNTMPDPGDDADDQGPSSKKNKFRGFFRKVTRTFEKNTNIRATDDEDRLLVGGLAIRL